MPQSQAYGRAWNKEGPPYGFDAYGGLVFGKEICPDQSRFRMESTCLSSSGFTLSGKRPSFTQSLKYRISSA